MRRPPPAAPSQFAIAMRHAQTFYGTPEGAGALCPAWLASDPAADRSGTLSHYLRLQELTRALYRGEIDETAHKELCERQCEARRARSGLSAAANSASVPSSAKDLDLDSSSKGIDPFGKARFPARK